MLSRLRCTSSDIQIMQSLGIKHSLMSGDKNIHCLTMKSTITCRFYTLHLYSHT